MYKTLIARGLFVVGLVTTMLVCNGNTAEIYDAVNDFSLSGNPNGAWSYGTLSSPTNGNFTSFATTATNVDFSGELIWSNGGVWPNFSGVVKNDTNGTVNWLSNVLPPNLLLLNPETLSADERWTSPSSGTYDVSGLFQRIDTTSSQPVTVGIVEDGTTTLFSATDFITFNAQEPFNDDNLFLPAGTTLDFYSFATGEPAYIGVGFDATITSVPEPSALVLLAAGAIVLVGYGLQRRRVTRTAKPTAPDQQEDPPILAFPSESCPASVARRAA